MPDRYFERSIDLPVSADAAFAWHALPGALERLLPPWDDVRVLRRSGGIEDGTQVELKMRLGPISVRWLAEHRDVDPPRRFRDIALRGPFPHWDHLHLFEPTGTNACRLTDRIAFRTPGGTLGRMLAGGTITGKLERVFRYRQTTTRNDLAMHAPYFGRPRLKIAISGSSGLIGGTLWNVLATGGHEVVPLKRGPENRIDVAPADGADAVIHLAGENIASGRWNDERRRRIRDSRVQVTNWLCDDLLALDSPPHSLLSASAVGFYGNRDDERLDEHSARGDGFLADVCVGWETATHSARAAGMRVANLRFGPVLSPADGPLSAMLPAFKLGAGGRVGSGKQQMSWVAIDDAVGAIHHVLMHDNLTGPVNVVAPEPVCNADFARTLARVLSRPAMMSLPAAGARLALGQMADELLLASQRVSPSVLDESGYQFRHATLEAALRHLLGRE